MPDDCNSTFNINVKALHQIDYSWGNLISRKSPMKVGFVAKILKNGLNFGKHEKMTQYMDFMSKNEASMLVSFCCL